MHLTQQQAEEPTRQVRKCDRCEKSGENSGACASLGRGARAHHGLKDAEAASSARIQCQFGVRPTIGDFVHCPENVQMWNKTVKTSVQIFQSGPVRLLNKVNDGAKVIAGDT